MKEKRRIRLPLCHPKMESSLSEWEWKKNLIQKRESIKGGNFQWEERKSAIDPHYCALITPHVSRAFLFSATPLCTRYTYGDPSSSFNQWTKILCNWRWSMDDQPDGKLGDPLACTLRARHSSEFLRMGFAEFGLTITTVFWKKSMGFDLSSKNYKIEKQKMFQTISLKLEILISFESIEKRIKWSVFKSNLNFWFFWFHIFLGGKIWMFSLSFKFFIFSSSLCAHFWFLGREWAWRGFSLE